MAMTLGAAQIADLARRLRAVSVADEWSEEPVRRLAAELGWEWSEGLAGPDLDAGLATGQVRLMPIAAYPEAYRTIRKYCGLHVPVVVSGDVGAAALADEFRVAAAAVTEALGPSSMLGSYGDRLPFGDRPPAWGSPFRRWVGPRESVEVRAVSGGVELIAMPNDRLAYWQRHEGFDGGFAAWRNRAAENMDSAMPEPYGAFDWPEFVAGVTPWMARFPAESRALGTDVALTLQMSSRPEIEIHLVCIGGDLQLGIGADDDVVQPDAGFEALGWTPFVSGPANQIPFDVAWVSDVVTPGQVPEPGPAHLLVSTMQALGVESPEDVVLAEWGETLDTPDHTDSYMVVWYGLHLVEGSRHV